MPESLRPAPPFLVEAFTLFLVRHLPRRRDAGVGWESYVAASRRDRQAITPGLEDCSTLSDDGSTDAAMSTHCPPSPRGPDLVEELRRARSQVDALAGEVGRLARGQQESSQRIGRLKVALRALLDDLECRVKSQEPLATARRDLPTVLREAHEALSD